MLFKRIHFYDLVMNKKYIIHYNYYNSNQLYIGYFKDTHFEYSNKIFEFTFIHSNIFIQNKNNNFIHTIIIFILIAILFYLFELFTMKMYIFVLYFLFINNYSKFIKYIKNFTFYFFIFLFFLYYIPEREFKLFQSLHLFKLFNLCNAYIHTNAYMNTLHLKDAEFYELIPKKKSIIDRYEKRVYDEIIVSLIGSKD